MTRTKRPARETSDRVSRIAGTVLAAFKKNGLDKNDGLLDGIALMGITLRELKALAASALAQDTTPGKRAKARRK